MKSALIALALAATLSSLSLEGQAQRSAKPLTEPELIDLLKNFVPPARVAELVKEKGIDFSLSPQQEQELRQAGADDALIDSLRELAPKRVEGTLPGTVRLNPKDGQRYVWIPPGTFKMGCSDGDPDCFDDEKPAHHVTLTKGFWMGQTAVTVAAWKRYRTAAGTPPLPTADNMGRKNWNEAGDDDMPAVMMTWDQAKGFCEWAAMRLPTEAEWEYAARAGSTANRYGDLDSIAWYGDNSGNARIDTTAIWKQLNHDTSAYHKKLYENGDFAHPVGLKQPNAWKLYDMLGNVWQWTADWHAPGYYATSQTQDPLGPPGGQYRAARGGSWGEIPRNVRLSSRLKFSPDIRNYYFGFRCAGELP